MAPNSTVTVAEEKVEEPVVAKPKPVNKLVWVNVTLLSYLHLSAVYGVYVGFTAIMWKTLIFALIYGNLGGIGITAGCHRLWSHRSYKARLPLRIFLCILTSIAGQNDIYEWCRDHRVHHKFTETDADPHNIKKGFFFAHVGWLMRRKHPEVLSRGKTVSMDDLWADPVVRFHRKYYIPMYILFSFYLPTMIPVWLWGEYFWRSFFVAGMARYCVSLNFTWLVNSAAHAYGNQPFDKYIEARDNAFVSFIGHGEGWHNYHHVFPWDYSTSELGYTLNLTKVFIDFMELIGLVYDKKTVSKEMILQKKLKSGDGTRIGQHNEEDAHMKNKCT